MGVNATNCFGSGGGSIFPTGADFGPVPRATAGLLRFGHVANLASVRNAADSGNIQILGVTPADVLVFGDAAYVSTFGGPLAIGALPATTGSLRFSYASTLTYRNNTNTANLTALKFGSALAVDDVVLNSAMCVGPSAGVSPLTDVLIALGQTYDRWRDVITAGLHVTAIQPITMTVAQLGFDQFFPNPAGGALGTFARIYTDSGRLMWQAGGVVSGIAVELRNDLTPKTFQPTVAFGTLDLGSAAQPWENLYLSGPATIQGMTVGLGGGAVASNVAFGLLALASNTTGFNNVALGNGALTANTTGSASVAIGVNTLNHQTTGTDNFGLGLACLSVLTTGSQNVAVGTVALQLVTGSGNAAFGFAAGRYETGSNAFYVNNQDRGNLAGDKALSLLYGVFDALATNQTLQVNAKFGCNGATPQAPAALGAALNAYAAGVAGLLVAADMAALVAQVQATTAALKAMGIGV